jgi:hypothetical protein
MPELKFFDGVIEKACGVCALQGKDGAYLLGEEGWFEVLEFLQKYLVDCGRNVEKIAQELNK